MKKAFHLLLLFAVALSGTLCSCEDEESVAEMRKKERKQIESFLQTGAYFLDNDSIVLLDVPAPIKVISEEEFYANDSTTNVDENEYVLFNSTGLYMQIVRKGTGKKLESGETATVICRYTEFNISTDSIQTTNNTLAYEGNPDIMTVQAYEGTFTGTWVEGVMKSAYSSTAVPNGWLYPLNYINLGRQTSADAEIALVRLIVPSSIGQSDATTNYYPCFYEITYQRGR